MKKIIISIAGIAIVLSSSIFLSGCGSKPTVTTTKVTDLTMYRPPSDAEFFKSKIANFNKQNTNYKMTYTEIPLENYEIDVLNSMAAQKGPDIWTMRNDWVAKDLDKITPVPDGYFKQNKKDNKTDLEHFKELFPPAVVKDLVINNKIYGIPLGFDTLVMYYNPSLMSSNIKKYNDWAQKNLKPTINRYPTTWEEVVALAPYLTKQQDGKITQSAIALGTSDNINRAPDILSLLMLQNGTQIVSADNLTATFNLNTQTAAGTNANPGLSALNFFTSFSNSTKSTYSWNSTMPDSIDAFVQGKVAMIIGYGYFEDSFKQKAPDFRYSSAPVPQISKTGTKVNYANYWVESVPKSSKYATTAWNFIKQYTSAAGSSEYAQAKHVSSAYITNAKADSTNPRISQPLTAQTFNKGKQPEAVDSLFAEMISNAAKGVDSQKAIDETATKMTNILRQ